MTMSRYKAVFWKMRNILVSYEACLFEYWSLPIMGYIVFSQLFNILLTCCFIVLFRMYWLWFCALYVSLKKYLKMPKVKSEAVNQMTDNTKTKRKPIKRQTIYTTLHRKLQVKHNNPTKNFGALRFSGRMNSSLTIRYINDSLCCCLRLI